MSGVSELEASYRWCRSVCRRSHSSFFSSFALLDRPRQQAMYALYAFSRISDDLSDSQDSVELRREKLLAWRDTLARMTEPVVAELPSDPWLPPCPPPHAEPTRPLASSRPLAASQTEGRPPARLPGSNPPVPNSSGNANADTYAPLWPALIDSVRRFRIPVHLLDAIVEGVTMDVEHQQPDDWPDLERYCYHVASSVGLACTYIWRASDTIPEELAVHCGMAFQLTNILRDVAEDARMGRIYLPRTLFNQYRMDPQAWLKGHPGDAWPAMLEEVAGEAYRRYSLGWPIIHSLAPRSQRMFSLMWRGYRHLLDKVVARPDHLWHAPKIRLSLHRRASLFATHFIQPLYARLSPPCSSDLCPLHS